MPIDEDPDVALYMDVRSAASAPGTVRPIHFLSADHCPTFTIPYSQHMSLWWESALTALTMLHACSTYVGSRQLACGYTNDGTALKL